MCDMCTPTEQRYREDMKLASAKMEEPRVAGRRRAPGPAAGYFHRWWVITTTGGGARRAELPFGPGNNAGTWPHLAAGREIRRDAIFHMFALSPQLLQRSELGVQPRVPTLL